MLLILLLLVLTLIPYKYCCVIENFSFSFRLLFKNIPENIASKLKFKYNNTGEWKTLTMENDNYILNLENENPPTSSFSINISSDEQDILNYINERKFNSNTGTINYSSQNEFSITLTKDTREIILDTEYKESSKINKYIRKLDTFIKAIYINNTSDKYNWWWCKEPGSETINSNDAYGCFFKEFNDIIKSGYNIVILTFYINKENCTGAGNDGCMDMIGFWNTMTEEKRKSLVKLLNDNNIAILGSFGGATVNGTDVNGDCCLANCKPVGKQCCMFPYNDFINNINTELNGIDIDLEGFKEVGIVSECMNNLNELIKQIKNKFSENGNPNPLITGAPQTPHFRMTNSYAINFTQYEKDYPNDFDFYNIQFYNQDGQISYSQLFSPPNDNPPNVEWLIQNGIPKNKIVLGKCSYPECHNNEHMNNEDFISYKKLMKFINDYKSSTQNQIKGIMYWQLYPKPPDKLSGIALKAAGDWNQDKKQWSNPGINGYNWLKN